MQHATAFIDAVLLSGGHRGLERGHHALGSSQRPLKSYPPRIGQPAHDLTESVTRSSGDCQVR